MSVCSHTKTVPPTPNNFIEEVISNIQSRDVKEIVKKIQTEHNLSYKDVTAIVQQLLPPSTNNKWPDVNLALPLKFPDVHAFNDTFSGEWYYMNVNGYLTTGERFYILRFLKRVGTNYTQGLEGTTRLINDISTCTIVDAQKNIKTYRSSYSYPCVSGVSPTASKGMLYIQQYPLKIFNGDYTLIELNETGDLLSMDFKGDSFSFHIEAQCIKPILLQGKNMNGLDPGADQFISKITGTSYMYYSWPSWKISGKSTITPLNEEPKEMDISKQWNLWLDHQGGNVKDPQYNLMSQFAMMFGMRPSTFPGWNWFSIQLFDNTQWTGFANKPWGNDTSYNHQQLQGTWSDAKGNLTWIYGSCTILKFWKSPEGINFGVEYKFDLGEYGIYHAKSIAYDQRVLEGTENYEGGVDVFKWGEDNKVVGYGNIECVGWATSTQRVDGILKFIGYDGLSKSERNTLANALTISVVELSTLFVIVFVIISGLLTWLTWWLLSKNTYLSHRKYPRLGVAIFIGLVVTAILYVCLYFLFKFVGCKFSHTCSVGKWNGCLFSCPK